MSNVDDDIISNISNNEKLEDVVTRQLSRRDVLGGGAAVAAAASLGGVGALLNAVPAEARHGHRPLLGFEGIPVSSADTVVVPEGYTAEGADRVGRSGLDGPRSCRMRATAAEHQAWQWGMHNDGLVYFPIHGSHHGLLVQNNEYTDDVLLFPDGTANWNGEDEQVAQRARRVDHRDRAGISDTGMGQADAGEGRRVARRPAVEVRAPHHRQDADANRRAGGRRSRA